MKRIGDITIFDHVSSLCGRHLADDDKILISVNNDGEVNWWSVTTTLEEALDDLSLYYRIDWRGIKSAISYRVFNLTASGELKL